MLSEELLFFAVLQDAYMNISTSIFAIWKCRKQIFAPRQENSFIGCWMFFSSKNRRIFVKKQPHRNYRCWLPKISTLSTILAFKQTNPCEKKEHKLVTLHAHISLNLKRRCYGANYLPQIGIANGANLQFRILDIFQVGVQINVYMCCLQCRRCRRFMIKQVTNVSIRQYISGWGLSPGMQWVAFVSLPGWQRAGSPLLFDNLIAAQDSPFRKIVFSLARDALGPWAGFGVSQPVKRKYYLTLILQSDE